MQFEAEVQLQHLLTAKNTKVQIFAARFAQLHHRHQAGPDHPEIAPGGPVESAVYYSVQLCQASYETPNRKWLGLCTA